MTYLTFVGSHLELDAISMWGQFYISCLVDVLVWNCIFLPFKLSGSVGPPSVVMNILCCLS